MTSSRPYLIRALYEWINVNAKTPYIIVSTLLPNVYVPKEYVNDNKIILNISPDAVYNLSITNTKMEFNASFSGISRHISAPIEAVMAIYAQENGKGMFFGDEPGGETPTPPDQAKESGKETIKKAHLKVIK